MFKKNTSLHKVIDFYFIVVVEQGMSEKLQIFLL